MLELMGASVELSAAGFHVAEPVIDRPLPEGAGRLVADATRAILRVDGVGTFAIAQGSRVRLEPEPAASEGALSMWLHGTVAALLLAQRGHFALHASVVDVGGVGVALAGLRRAGKSTTALRLTQLGHRLVTDDVSPLITGDHVTVHPYTRPVYVLAETAATLGLDVSGAQPVLPEHPKLALSASAGGPVPLGAIVVLEASETGPIIDAMRVGGAQAHWLVSLNIYRVNLLRDLWETEMFAWAAAVAQTVPVHVVRRPAEEWTVDAVANTVERIALSRTRSAP
jgi:HPr Serine kinase C-terminal domain